MITIKEEIVISHDEPLLSECEKKLTKENGFYRSEDTVAVTFIRIQFFKGGETE